MKHLLLAIDQFDSGQVALMFTADLAKMAGAEILVMHVRERPVNPRVPPLERLADAQQLVDEAVHCLRLAGLDADGRVRAEREDHVAKCIVDQSTRSGSDAIVLGSRRLRSWGRFSGHGVKERVIRATVLPVVVAPTTVMNRVHVPYDSPSLSGP